MAGKRLATDTAGRRFEVGRACVQVRREKNALVVQDGGIQIARPSTLFGMLTPGIKVMDGDGNELPATGTFYISLETIDPYHLLTDVSD